MKEEFYKFKPLRCPLTPYQLFSPVSTVFLDNISYEEQLLGLYNKFNEFIAGYNQLTDFVNQLPEQITDMQEAIKQMQIWLQNQIVDLGEQIESASINMLALSKQYTDNEIAKLPGGRGEEMYDPTTGLWSPVQTVIYNVYNVARCGALTAEEYDSKQLTAEAYDNKQLTAYNYDVYGKVLIN